MKTFTVTANVSHCDGKSETVTDEIVAEDWADAFISFCSALVQEDPSIRNIRMSKPQPTRSTKMC